jgi:hypothetical protein
VNAEATAALAKHPGVYQRAGQLVRVVRDVSKLAGVTRPPNSPTITVLPRPLLREHLTEVAAWQKWSKSKEVWESAHPPDWAVNAIDARGEWPGIRALEAVVEAPVLRPDGTLLQEPGYDQRTGLLYIPSGRVDPVKDEPTLQDAHDAVAALLEVIWDFPFQQKDLHRTCWLAALLTPLARMAARGPAPLFMVDANTPGTGKSKLVTAISLLVAGRQAAVMGYTADDPEMEKRITSAALAGDSLIALDNISSAFGGESLDRALTSMTWKARLLGGNEQKPFPMLATWFATGNNIELAGDMRRRVLPIRLCSDLERPEERSDFQHADLTEAGGWLERERPRLLAAALTILRAYVVAGRPAQELRPWGSYEAWSGLVRAALSWVGLPDVAEARTDLLQRSDPEVGGLGLLLKGWLELDPRREGVSAQDALARLKADHAGPRQEPPQPERFKLLRSALLELCPGPGGELPSPRALSARFRKLRERSIGGLALDTRTLHGGMQGWFVRGGSGGDSGDSGDSVTPVREENLGLFSNKGSDDRQQSHQSHQSHRLDPNWTGD